MNHAPKISRKKRRREFTGCWNCRDRKVKCDESHPCSSCKRLGLACDGSSARLVWLDENKSYRSTGRRLMHCERTWENHPILESETVDLLISQCDFDERAEKCLMNIDININVNHNPFSVFSALHATPFNTTSIGRILPNESRDVNSTTVEDGYLFHHYVDYVASVMMPFEHPSNPWKVFYPSVSIRYLLPGEKALYHAIIAHSAFNLAYLGPGNTRSVRLRSATRHYNRSIQYVNESIGSGERDSGSTLAAIMTLMMAEVYSGQSKKWKHHLQGAWALLLNSNYFESWDESPFTRFSVQSLLIVRIIGGTTLAGGGDSQVPDLQHASQQNLRSLNDCSRDLACTSSILSTPGFGFTIGAHKSLLGCISSITDTHQRIRSGLVSDDSFEVELSISRVLNCLQGIRLQLNEDNTKETSDQTLTALLARYQLNAFIYATYIYLYRSLLDVPPHRVAKYVNLVFSNTAAFHSSSGGNFSLWPAFIAAVEAFSEDDLHSAQKWLEQATNFGLGNRFSVKRIVENVWKERELVHLEKNVGMGLIAVDWRKIANDLGADILLV